MIKFKCDSNHEIMTFIKILEEQGYQTKSFPKGSVLFYEGEECRYIGLVKSGLIRILSYSSKGTEIVFNEIKPNDFFGVHLVFGLDNKYKGNVVANIESEIFLVKKEDFQKLMQQPVFFEEYMKLESSFVKSLNHNIKLLSLSSAEERFLFFLQSKGGKITFINVTELAKSVHLERETLSRLISKLEKRHLIRRLSHQIILLN